MRSNIATGICAGLVVAGLLGCSGGPADPVEPAESEGDTLAQDAAELSQQLLLVDTHIDVPYRLQERPDDISRRTEGGDFDHPRAVAGGLDVAFMSIYVPASYQETGGARELADELIDGVEGWAEDHPDRFRLVRSVAEAREVAAAEGVVGLAMGMENGAPIGDDLGLLTHFFERGIRYVTLTHSENNLICDSSYAAEKRWNGLSDFGREVVAEMNRLGIMVDISHVTDATFDDVLEITAAPVIASHSSCRSFTPGWERNMSDAMIRRLAANGGVIQINFGSSFLDDTYRLASKARRDAIQAHFDEHGIDEHSEAGREYARRYEGANPIPVTDVARVADHIDHVVDLVGIDHVGLGSDFDGVGDSLPRGLEDVSRFPNLLAELLSRGYTEEQVAKIWGGNLLRVWGRVEQVARELQEG